MLADVSQNPRQRTSADSLRDLEHAKSAQRNFERSRRALLPQGSSSGGRCDVRLGRYCWWYDAATPKFPAENETIGRRREELLAELDSAAARQPGDDWLAAMRVHYRIDAKAFDAADSAATSCRATSWWCSALVGYAATAHFMGARADSAFTRARGAMPPDVACKWSDIRSLLSGDDRDAYEKQSCEARVASERRYWLLSKPQLNTAANDWENEFNVRRVIIWLGERAATPHLLGWGDDAAELVLRYGWPVAWSQVQTSSVGATEPSIIGHDPSPSFAFAPNGWLADTTRSLGAGAWDFNDARSTARFAPRGIRRVTVASAQYARFRRGDSTLVVTAYVASDDSLRNGVAMTSAAAIGVPPATSPADTTRLGRAQLRFVGTPLVAGAEVVDTATGTLARSRVVFPPSADSGRIALSDVLIYRAGEEPAPSLDSALARAIPGDTATRNKPIGLFWETYGLFDAETVDVAVSVERIDHSWIRSARQRLGLTPVDTPIRIRWTDTRPRANGASPHAISLDLENLDSGRYRVTLSVTPLEGKPVTSTREIELIDP
ncbi:MAG: hypothetical protein V4550_10735 [Gemmatimonadota bacterium]